VVYLTPLTRKNSKPEAQAGPPRTFSLALGSTLGLLLWWTPSAFAQKTPDDPPFPVAGRPVDFSNIVGKYDIKATADPTDLQVEQSITLRIQIIGAGRKEYEPNRKYLRLFPDSWKNDFYVQEMPDKHEVVRDRKTWLFVYRLKPKHVKVNSIDDIKLVYYDPDIRDKQKFVTKYANSIMITVKPKLDKSDEVVVPLSAAPDSFFEHVDAGHVLARSPAPFSISSLQLICLIALPPLACLFSVIAWRRYFPDETQRAIQHRAASAARALAQLQTGSVPAWDIVRRYLRDRFDFPVEDPTPSEVSAFLKRRGVALALCEQSRTFLQACDAARYTSGAVSESKQLFDAGAGLIQDLEADPCARG
jgi:hypothetical protein